MIPNSRLKRYTNDNASTHSDSATARLCKKYKSAGIRTNKYLYIIPATILSTKFR